MMTNFTDNILKNYIVTNCDIDFLVRCMSGKIYLEIYDIWNGWKRWLFDSIKNVIFSSERKQLSCAEFHSKVYNFEPIIKTNKEIESFINDNIVQRNVITSFKIASEWDGYFVEELSLQMDELIGMFDNFQLAERKFDEGSETLPSSQVFYGNQNKNDLLQTINQKHAEDEEEELQQDILNSSQTNGFDSDSFTDENGLVEIKTSEEVHELFSSCDALEGCQKKPVETKDNVSDPLINKKLLVDKTSLLKNEELDS